MTNSIMRSRLFTRLSAVSFVLVVTTAMLWIRGIGLSDVVEYAWKGGVNRIWCDYGIIDFQHVTYSTSLSNSSTGWNYEVHRSNWNLSSSMSHWKWMGFRLVWDVWRGQKGGNYHVGVPYWFIIAATGILPWRWFRRWRRFRNGLCQECGYDCRATPQRCPECGVALENI